MNARLAKTKPSAMINEKIPDGIITIFFMK
jgi:hypothetical protein